MLISATHVSIPSGAVGDEWASAQTWGGELRCEIVTDFARLEALSSEWQRLWQANPRAEIFQSFAWMRASWKAFGSARSLCTPLVYDGGKLIGALPLAMEGGEVTFLGWPCADYNDVICREQDATRVMDTALRSAYAFSTARNYRLVLRNVCSTSMFFRAFDSLAPDLRSRMTLIAYAGCPFVQAGDGPTRVYRPLVEKGGLKRYRYYRKRLESIGRLSFRHIEDHGEIRGHLPDFFRAHVARRAVTGIRSEFLQTPVRRLFEALVEEFDPRTCLRFSVLRVGEKPIAYQFGFQTGNKFVYYSPTFDLDFWDYNPGEVLLRELLQYAVQEGLAEFDFGVGDEEYKTRFANDKRYVFTIHVEDRKAIRTSYRRFRSEVKKALVRWPAAQNSLIRITNARKRIVSDFEVVARREGTGRALVVLCARFLRSVCRVRAAALLHLSDETAIGSETAEALSLFKVTEARLAELAGLSLEYPDELAAAELQQFRQRLKARQRCFLLWDGDAATGWAWASRLPGRENTVLLRDVWEAPRVRRGGDRTGQIGGLIAAVVKTYSSHDLWLYLNLGRTTSEKLEHLGLEVVHSGFEVAVFEHLIWQPRIPPIFRQDQH